MKLKKILFSTAALILSISLFSGCTSTTATPSPVATTPIASAASSSDTLSVMALKGPTAMGMVKLIEDSAQGKTAGKYNFSIVGTADEITAKIVKGEVDIAAVPCNLASVLYNKTNGSITVTNINTLGVLYIVENGTTINSVKDLKGKTIYSTGKGTTPEYTLNYILKANGLDPEKDVNIVYKSEATEVAAMLEQDTAAVAMLPQPYVTTVITKNKNLRIALDISEQWNKVSSNGSGLVTGVLIIRNDVLKNKKDLVNKFLDEYKASTQYTNNNIAEASTLIEKNGIVTAAIAKTAIPKCNITYIDGSEMKSKISGYLKVLYDQNPASVGGKLPDDNFYYTR